MKKILYLITVLFLFFSACNEPVFYMVSTQIRIPPPRIGGKPTNFVEFDSKMFVASYKTIYSYNGTNGWTHYSTGLERIDSLAASSTRLFVRTTDDRVFVSPVAGFPDFTEIDYDGYIIKKMFNANGQVFFGAKTGSSYTILHSNAEGTVLTNLFSNDIGNHLLRGVAYDNSSYYYFITTGGAIYRGSTSSASAFSVSEGRSYVGIVYLGSGDGVVFITREGAMYKIEAGALTDTGKRLGNLAAYNCSPFVYKESNVPKLLLVPIQDKLQYGVETGYTYGYREIELDGSGNITGESFKEPGTSPPPSTLPVSSGSYERYRSTIGKYPVSGFFQADDEILFAGTQKNGVWSLRDRDDNGTPYWNAEE